MPRLRFFVYRQKGEALLRQVVFLYFALIASALN